MKEQKKKDKVGDFIFYLVVVMFVAALIFGCVDGAYKNKKMKITKDDWAYMYDFIQSNYGRGEKMHVTDKRIDNICDDPIHFGENGELIGKRVVIYCTFGSSDEEYVFSFHKYAIDQYNEKAGTLIFEYYPYPDIENPENETEIPEE